MALRGARRIGRRAAAGSGLLRQQPACRLSRICALATVMYSVGDLNGRSYAKFHPSLRFSAVYLLLLERLRRPFGPAPDAGGRGSFRHGTVGYFPAVVGGRVSRQSLFRGPWALYDLLTLRSYSIGGKPLPDSLVRHVYAYYHATDDSLHRARASLYMSRLHYKSRIPFRHGCLPCSRPNVTRLR